MISNTIGAFLVGLFVSFLVMPIIINVLKKRNLIDSPDRRKIHRGFIPSMGGIGIMIGILISILIWLTIDGISSNKYLLAGMVLLSITGMRDDLLPIKPRYKIMVQILSAILVILNGVIIDSGYGLFGFEELNITLRLFLTVGFIIFITNAYNLIDGLDGLAGSVALVISLFFAVWFYLNESYYLSIISIATAGSIIGFLYYNWNPAKIFMGDTGALSLGFLFSVFSILFLNQNNKLSTEIYQFKAPISAIAAILIFPLFDTIRIIIVRLVKKKSPFEPDKNHAHHVLMRLGLSHRQIAIIVGTSNILFIAFVVIFRDYGDYILLPILIGISFTLSVILDQLIIHEVRTRRAKTRKRIKLTEKSRL